MPFADIHDSKFHVWELVAEQRDIITERMRVPSGWLYKVVNAHNPGNPVSIALTFVPHPWENV
jgi:hypothetical protein